MRAANVETPSTRASLLIRIRHKDDRDAWALFVETYTPLMLRYCRRWGLQDADAGDVAQTVFGIVMQSIGNFEYDREKGRFRNWLGTITRREIRHYCEKLKRRGGSPVCFENGWESLAQDLDSEWVDEFNAQIYQCAIERIRPSFGQETWNAFDLTWVRDQKPALAAAQMGKPVAWVSRAKYRVLQKLREELEFLADDAAVLAGLQGVRG